VHHPCFARDGQVAERRLLGRARKKGCREDRQAGRTGKVQRPFQIGQDPMAACPFQKRFPAIVIQRIDSCLTDSFRGGYQVEKQVGVERRCDQDAASM
jgi:hypothetical protein